MLRFQSPLVGKVVVENGQNEEAYGLAGIFSPCDNGFPDLGVIIEGKINVTDLIFAELDVGKLEYVRSHGQVKTLRDTKSLASRKIDFKVYKNN